jgi:hypothetical protein
MSSTSTWSILARIHPFNRVPPRPNPAIEKALFHELQARR